MSIYRKAGLWIYDFWFQERRYILGRGLMYKADAEEAEAALKRTLRRRAAGLEPLAAEDTPSFSNWAAVTWKWQRVRKGLKRPEAAKQTLRMILAFWGAKPATNPVKDAPYHNLRLGDPIQEPEWIARFEDWMTARGLSGSRKNHYRSACSMIYRVALQPEHRTRAGVRENPFRDLVRDRVARRTRVLDPDTIATWVEVAPLPAVVAVPHKTDRETGLPLTVAISTGLRAVLAEVERVFPRDPYVVPLEAQADKERYWPLVTVIRRSIEAAGLPYGKAGRRRDVPQLAACDALLDGPPGAHDRRAATRDGADNDGDGELVHASGRGRHDPGDGVTGAPPDRGGGGGEARKRKATGAQSKAVPT